MTRRRRLVLVAGWVLCGLLLASGVRLALLMADEALGMHRWNSADYTGARSAFSRTTYLDPWGAWIGHFNVGTADYELGNYAQAVADFRSSLATAPAEKHCLVALNLSWSYETMGDVADEGGDRSGAEQAWQQSRSALSQLQCRDDSSDSKSSQSASASSSSSSSSSPSSSSSKPSAQASSQDSQSPDPSQQNSDSQEQQRQQTIQRVDQKIDQAQSQAQNQQQSSEQQQAQLQQRQQEAQSTNAQSQGTAPASNPTGRNW